MLPGSQQKDHPGRYARDVSFKVNPLKSEYD
jgi:hypothetical protein